jgi:hypothetical protein
MPFAQRLTPEQGVMAYLWGESTHSFATVPAKAGESVRIVGMDDFIIGAWGSAGGRPGCEARWHPAGCVSLRERSST